MNKAAALALACGLGFHASAQGQEDATASPVHHGLYLAPMATYRLADDRWHADDGIGGTLAAGYRFGAVAIELTGAYSKLGHDLGDDDTEVTDLGGNVLYFPFAQAGVNVYGMVGGGRANADHWAFRLEDDTIVDDDFKAEFVHVGLGNLFAFSLGRYDMAIRAEVLTQHTQRRHEDRVGDEPRWFHDVIFNLGVQLPLGARAPEPPPTEVPTVAVVAPVAICSDGQDNDGDGQVDFPADLGCGAEGDPDETDPAQCANGRDDDGDGQVDHPADKGCSGADDNDETDACRAPAPGEPVSLKGCATGDVIVLRGVNFDFDKSSLTRNARTLLDDVAAELAAYPDIRVEIGGHTDAKGTDEYNLALSKRRAESVRQYLIGKEVAPERMTSAGYGESQPVADNESDEGRELNRRVELKVTAGVASVAAP